MSAIEKPSIIFFAASIAGATYFQFKEATPKLWRYILPFIIALFTIALVATIIVIRRKPQATHGEFGAPFVPDDSQGARTDIAAKKVEEVKISDLERPVTPEVKVNQSGTKSDNSNSQDDKSLFKGSDFYICRNVKCKIFQNISLVKIEDKQEFISFFRSIFNKNKFNSPKKRRRKGVVRTFYAEEVDNLYKDIINTMFTPEQMNQISKKLNGKKSESLRNKTAIKAIANALNLEESSVSHIPS